MGKLVIKYQGKLVREVNLKLGDTKIGRKPSCDLVLEDPAVSAEHALVRTVGLKSSIQDLGSTNGTFVENHRIKQHELRNGETITIGAHSLIYRDAINLETAAFGRGTAAPVPRSVSEDRKTTVLIPFAQLVAIDGKDKGKRVPLVKEVVIIENPGKSPARISRTESGYLLEASVGAGEPRLNDKPILGGQVLENGDILEVAGTKYKFFK